MKFLVIGALLSCVVYAQAATKATVTTANELRDAIAAANPGDVIDLADGYYKGTFEATRSGNEGQPITLQGSRDAILAGNNYGFWLKADHWVLRGFSVVDSNKGIVVEGGNFNELDDLEVYNIKQEGVHFRWNSADNIIHNSYVHHTGQGSTTDQGYGEGVYLGQAVSNWQNGEPDRSDRNQVINNQIGPEVAAEAIDIKEGSCCGVVQGNRFVGPEKGQNSADSWVDVKGDNYLIEGNDGENPLTNGFEIHYISSAGMGACNNRIINNHCSGLPGGGQCAVSFHDCNNDLSGNSS